MALSGKAESGCKIVNKKATVISRIGWLIFGFVFWDWVFFLKCEKIWV